MGLSLSLLLAFLHLGVMLALEPIVARTPDTMNCFASRLGDVNGTRGGSWLEMSTPLVVVDAGNLERVVKMGTKLNET